MDTVITWLQTLDGATVLTVLGICVFLESAAFLGLVAPGELALLSAGAAAAGGRTSLAGALAVGFAAAVLGETVGYVWGLRQGPRLLAWAGRHPRLGRHVPTAVARVRARGFAVVILSRWNGLLRALVPIVAGSARMPVARFGAANLLGAALWTVVVVMVGDVAAESARDAGNG